LYVLLALAVIIIAMAASAILFKEQIIKQFIAAANEQLSTPVKIGKIDVSAFQHFPQLSIVLTDVEVEDSHPGKYPLLTAAHISFQLNPIEVYRGVYNIRGLEIRDSETTLKINQEGKNNYTILKESSEGSTGGAIGFELKNVKLTNTRVRYVDLQQEQDLIFLSDHLAASIHSSDNLYTIRAIGELTTQKLSIKRTSLLEGKSFQIDADLIYNDAERLLTIEPSTLLLKNSSFAVKGTYRWKETPTIDIAVDGKNTNLQTLVSLLPEKTAEQFEKYKSQGEAYFTANLKGTITSKRNPSLSVEFGLRDATLQHPETKVQLTKATVEGSFASTNISDLHQAVLVLKNISGSLNGEVFQANLVVQDFIDSDVILNFKGLIDVASLTGFYPIKDIRELSGKLQTDVAFEGKVSWLKSKATAQRASTTGTILLQHVNFVYGNTNFPVKNLNGTLQFNNNDLALSDVSVKAGNSDFIFNGFFKNVITFLLFENQPIGIEADLKSRFMDVDELFALGFGSGENQSSAYEFSISPNIHLNFNCDIGSLRYQRFYAQKLKGDLLVKNEVAVSRGINLKTMGGDLTLSGIVDAKNRKAIDVMTTAKLNGIHIDSVFYVFKNFNQTFIEDRHLKGRATADVNFELTLNEKLKLFQETLVADISMVIKNGELNNFEPMQKLNKYLDDDGLHKLRFADLKNDIHIENKTVYIPQMAVRSNVTTIQISGTHGFDQQIDYRLIAPLRSRVNATPEAEDSIEEQGGQLKVYLKITGTTDDYRVQYDTEAVKKKIVSDLKKEVQELKDAFKTKGKKKKKELELEKDDYFDWEDN
jgi:hypothetical protein